MRVRQIRTQGGIRSAGRGEKTLLGVEKGEKTRGGKGPLPVGSHPPLSSFRAKRSGDPEPSGAREREPVADTGG